MDVISPWDRIYEVLRSHGIEDAALTDELHKIAVDHVRQRIADRVADDLQDIYAMSISTAFETPEEMIQALKDINNTIFTKIQKLSYDTTKI